MSFRRRPLSYFPVNVFNGSDGSEQTQYIFPEYQSPISFPASSADDIYTIPSLRHRRFVIDPVKPKKGHNVINTGGVCLARGDVMSPTKVCDGSGRREVALLQGLTKSASNLSFNSGNIASSVPTFTALL